MRYLERTPIGRPFFCPEHGFTLVELVAVIAILVVFTISAYPLLTGRASAPLTAAIDIVMSDIRLTQAGAMSTGEKRSITFTADSGKYRYDNNESSAKTRDLSEVAGCLKFTQNLAIHFNSMGEPVQPSQFLISINCFTESGSIAIEPVTGHVSKQ